MKFITLNRLSDFLNKLKVTFAALVHTHTLKDILDYVVDSELSSTSSNPIQNSAVNTAMDELSSKLVGKTTTGEVFTIDGSEVTAAENAEIFNNYTDNIATGKYSHAEGYQTTAKGSYSHVEGYGTFASGAASHAEGYDTKATARYSHAEGASTTASGNNSHAEGQNTTSSGHYSHAEGNYTTSSGGYSHAEGNYTTASETYAHAEGSNTTASKVGAHAEGNYTVSNGAFSHTEGYYTSAQSAYQHVRGKYNELDYDGVYSTIIGNGTSDSDRSNIHTLDWNGNSWFKGNVKIGGTGYNDENAKTVATTEDIANLVNSAPETLDTLGELAAAFQENKEVVDVLNDAIITKADADTVLYKTPQELTVDEVNQVHKNLKLENLASEDQVEALYKSLTSNRALRFYCIEDVTIVLNGISTTYPANSNVEVKFLETDEFEIIPTSENSILALNSFPGALGTYYSWLEGVKQFSNILFDMNAEDMYSKWSQGNQSAYQVQYAQYLNCIFWSDNPYISDVAKRTNYTLYYTSQLPLCYSTIPDNTFKAFYLAFSVTSDPNWGNKAYRDSFAKATWATQAFSYYGARTIGVFGHDDPDFNIVLPKDCRGLMYAATAIENAGTFDAANTTNFGASSGSWRDAFGKCSSLRNLYIKNLKVNLNISWSPINYNSIYFIISNAANANAITITVSPYTYNLLGSSDFDLAVSKNITISLLTDNYVEDRRLSDIANKADKTYVDTNIENKKDKDLIVSRVSNASTTITHSVAEISDAVDAGRTVKFLENVELFNLLEINRDYGYATFFMLYMNEQEKLQSQTIVIVDNEIYQDLNNVYDFATKEDLNNIIEDITSEEIQALFN